MSEESNQRNTERRNADAANLNRSTNEIAEQAYVTSTDKEDLASATHSTNIPIEDEADQNGEIIDGVPQRYSESYGTGAKQPPQSR